MRHLSFLAFALLLCMKEGVAVQIQNDSPILMKERAGGFLPIEEMGFATKIAIYGNGQIIKSIRYNYSSPWRHVPVAMLSTDIVNDLVRTLASLEEGPVAFPDEPECYDALSIVYSGKARGDRQVNFIEKLNCRTGILRTFPAALRLQQILDGLEAIAQLE